MKQLGDILLDGGLVTPSQLDGRRATSSSGSGAASDGCSSSWASSPRRQLVAALATADRHALRRPQRLPGRRLGAWRRVPRHGRAPLPAIPIGCEDGKLVVAMADPSNVFAVDDIRALAGAGGPPGRRRPRADHRDDRPVLPRRRRRRRRHAGLRRRERRGRPISQRPRGRRGRADRQVRQPARSPRRSRTAPPTSTSSRPSTTCGSGSASTACCTRCMRSPQAASRPA